MKFKTIKGYDKNVNIEKYRIKWDAPSLSKFQFGVKQFLQTYWYYHVCYEEMRVAGSRLSLDLFNLTKRCAVEIQGIQHLQYNKHFHSNSRQKYMSQVMRDMDKHKWCEINNIKLIEIYPQDLPLSKEFFKNKFDFIL